MHSIKSTLEYLVQKSGSGIPHPYYSVKSFLHSDKMLARVSVYPPLGQDTVIPARNTSTTFHALLETQAEINGWEVQLWHNWTSNGDWTGDALAPTSEEKLHVIQSSEQLHSRWYAGALQGKPESLRPISFTLRFRTHPGDSWKWVRDHSGVDDGQLYFQASPSALLTQDDLSHYIDGISMELKVSKVKSDTPGTLLWSITAPVEPAPGRSSGYSDHPLGLPKHFSRWFALCRLWSPWLAPRHGKSLPLAEKDCILYSFLRTDGQHVVILAISGIEDVLTILRHQDDKLVINSRNDREEQGTARVLVAVGQSFDSANCAVMYEARRVVMALSKATNTTEEQQEAIQKAEEYKKSQNATWIQTWVDGFSYCTWNGLGQNLNEEKISSALAELSQAGVKVTNLIIDDNWQSLDNKGQSQFVRGWTEFEANREGFPKGLGAAVKAIRSKHPHINHIAVWHALLGYWGGISPHGKIAEQYKTVEVQKRDGLVGGKMLVVDEPDVKRMYDDFYSFLSGCGIDAVKTDAQFFLDEIDTAPERRSLTNTYLDVWVAAQLRHFYATAISCMSQTPPILFRCQLPSNVPEIPVRNSDDFFPDVEESHPWHIFCNASVALFTQHLNVLPDWDMFQTSHPWSGFHAAARCVSGGPIYITDEPGKHNLGLIKQMTAQTTGDQTVILRPSVVGRTVSPYTAYEEERLCKIGAYHGFATTGASFLGIFNCRDHAITEVIPLSDFMGTEGGNDYVLKSHRTGLVSRAMTARDANAAVMGIEVRGRGWEVLTATPVLHFSSESRFAGLKISNLGLTEQMTGAAALETSDAYVDETGKRLRIATRMKALGVWGVWVSALKELSLEDNFLVIMANRAVPFECVEISEKDCRVVLVDVARAWRALNLDSGWSNEVQVEMHILLAE